MRKVVTTHSGMYALWEGRAFPDVVDYDSWESRLLEDADIENEIAAGHLVPINIHADGVSEIEVRVGTANDRAVLASREEKYLTVSTPAPYLLKAGDRLHFGGIEHVHAEPVPETGALSLAPGRYEVHVHLIDWQQEPGMTNPDGSPLPGALPDFIVLLNPANGAESGRLTVNTFD